MKNTPNPQQPTLSARLDEARAMEEHYRTLLLFWKKRRQDLEALIPFTDASGEMTDSELINRIQDFLNNPY